MNVLKEMIEVHEDFPPADGLAKVMANLEGAIAACAKVSEALQSLGGKFSMCGRRHGLGVGLTGASPFGFGNDGLFALGTVTQSGGELAAGAITLLSADNKYAAAVLMRQVLEVEYLVWVFASDHTIAAEWLRADGATRKKCWSPAELRSRSGGHFSGKDYWHHCDIGGHPTREGTLLLPLTAFQAKPEILWAELTHHLTGALASVLRAGHEMIPGGIPPEWMALPANNEVDAVIKEWRSKDCPLSKLADFMAEVRARSHFPLMY